jgi:hypothetical protein
MGHGHDHGTSFDGRRLFLSVFITVAFVIGSCGWLLLNIAMTVIVAFRSEHFPSR